MESLSDKLNALGAIMGSKMPASQETSAASFPIESIIPLKIQSNLFGEAYYRECIYPVSYQHGRVDFSLNPGTAHIMSWGRCKSIGGNLEDFLFFDTETTGLAGGSGTIAFLIGIGYWQHGQFHILQYFLPAPFKEAAMLVGFDEVIGRFPVIVSFNGKTFDAPLIKTRHIMNMLENALAGKDHLDLLHLSRKLWKNRLPSRRLGDLERDVINYSRSEEEIPGWMIPEIYADYLSTNDARMLKGVFYHNEVDILSLAALFLVTSQILQDPGSLDLPGLDLISLAGLYEDIGAYQDAIRSYETGLKYGLPPEFLISALTKYADVHRRHGDLEMCINMWQKAAEYGSPLACIELSKHFEHRVCDSHTALTWAFRGLSLQCSPQEKIDLKKRTDRLLKKVQALQNDN